MNRYINQVLFPTELVSRFAQAKYKLVWDSVSVIITELSARHLFSILHYQFSIKQRGTYGRQKRLLRGAGYK